MRGLFSVAFGGLLSLTAAGSVALGAVAFDATGAGFVFESSRGSDMFYFKTNEAITVTDVGYYDFGQDGLVLSHDVGIFDYDAGGVRIGGASVGPGAELDGFFRYAAIAPLTLLADHVYAVSGFHPGLEGDEILWERGGEYDPAIEFLGYLGLIGGTQADIFLDEVFEGQLYKVYDPADPENDFLDPAFPGFFGPNFRFEAAGPAVPEPGTLALLGLGGLGMSVGAWRRKRAAPAG